MDDQAASLDPGGHLASAAADCVHCGFCLPACPTYQLWGEEMDSPRGRIHLISQVLDGAPVTESVTTHLDRCLGCMACVTACPSGVRYNELIEAARAWAPEPAADFAGGGHESRAARPLRERAVRAAIFATFPYPNRLRALAGPLRAAQRAGLDRLAQLSAVAGYAPELAASLRLAPRPPTGNGGPPARQAGHPRRGRPSRTWRLPARVPARGPRRAVVGMLTGCVQQVFFPQVNAATARVLAAEGCDVIIPRGQGCCGALSLHSGRPAEAARFAEQTIATFEREGVDAVVVNSAGCGSAMKEFGAMFAQTPPDAGTPGPMAGSPQSPGSPAGRDTLAGRAETFSGRVRDFSEFLIELYERLGGTRAVRHELAVTAVYHDACHLAHAQRIRQQPRDLLRGIPGLEVAEAGDGMTCCGSAGVYNLLQPEAAAELGERKAAALRATGARLIVSGNPGCSLQIAAAMAADGGEPVAVAHIAEVLDASLRGLPVTILTGQ
jgi:glycolate oxidase iron-sulfur subunit